MTFIFRINSNPCMSDIAHFFTPVNTDVILDMITLKEQQFGNLFTIYSDDENFPDLENIDLAIVGVTESRNAGNNEGCQNAPDAVRRYLYQLYGGSFDV